MGRPAQSSRPMIYEGDVRLLKAHSDWIGAEDVFNAEPTLTIKRVLVYAELRVNGGLKRNALVLQFEEKAKGLIVGATNRKLIARALGTAKAKDWPGQKITLHTVLVKAPPGAETDKTWGVRVKVPLPNAEPEHEPSRLDEPSAVFEQRDDDDPFPEPSPEPPPDDFDQRTDNTEPPADWQGGVTT